MRPKIIKVSAFEDGTFTIKAPPFPHPGMLPAGDGAQAADDDAPPAIDPRVALAEAEAKQILDLAHQAALALRESAREEAEAAKQQAFDDGMAAGHAEGLALGLGEGRSQGLAEQAGLLQTLAEAVAQFDRQRVDLEEAHAQELAKLAIVIAQKLLVVELGHGREAAVPLAREALKHVTDKTQVRVRVHPLDKEAILAAKQQLLLAVDGLTQLDVVADPQVGLGGCLVETRAGLVDARLTTQLAEVAAAMLDVRVGVEEGAEMDPLVQAAIRALGRGGTERQEAEKPKVQLNLEARVPKRKAEQDAAAKATAEAHAVLEAARAEAAALLAQAQAAAMEAIAIAPLFPEASPAPDALDAPPELPSPAGAGEGTPEEAPAEPEAAVAEVVVPQAPAAPAHDPSKRAAQALAARLGQFKAGRAVLSLEEELELKQFEQGLKDAELEAIVRQANMPRTSIGATEALVWQPPKLEDAADTLAERLGQRPKQRKETPEGALADDAISAILDGVGVRAAGDDDGPAAAPAEEPNIEKATDNLAKLLGAKRKKSNRPWYDQI